METIYAQWKLQDILPRLVSNYNARKHRIIGMRPIDVTSAIADRLLSTFFTVALLHLRDYKVGDLVCVSKFKTIFDKDYSLNWSTEVFKIIKVQQTNPVTYLLEDFRGEYLLLKDSLNMNSVVNLDVHLVEKVLHDRGTKRFI